MTKNVVLARPRTVARWRVAAPAKPVKPAKPYPDFPLFPHATRRWAKKIRGRFVFFGPWNDAQGAIERYVMQRDALMAGLVPRPLERTLNLVTTVGWRVPNGLTSAVSGRRAAPRSLAGVTADDGENATPGHVANTASTSDPDGLTLRDLVNRFLTAKKKRVDSEELKATSFGEYLRISGRLVKSFGPYRLATDLKPVDFARFRDHLAKTRGPVSLSGDITKVRTIFRFAEAEGLIDRLPRYGPGFDKPSRTSIRKARSARGVMMFERDEIATLLAAASLQVKAMILLGLNCGLGNTDVASLPRSAVNLTKATLEFPRPKTGIARRAVLWPETVEVLKTVAKARPKAVDPKDKSLVFLTRYGKPWTRIHQPKGGSGLGRGAIALDSVSSEFSKLVRDVGVHRPGRSFYALRHTFRTIADELGDRRAIDLIMGHENGNDMSNYYVERVSQERLAKVAEHVRAWARISQTPTAAS